MHFPTLGPPPPPPHMSDHPSTDHVDLPKARPSRKASKALALAMVMDAAGMGPQRHGTPLRETYRFHDGDHDGHEDADAETAHGGGNDGHDTDTGGDTGDASDADEPHPASKRRKGTKRARAGAGVATAGPGMSSKVEAHPCERLAEFVMPTSGCITPLDLRTLDNPVVVIHAPRKAGCTTLIASLLAGIPGLNAAVVLTDRASPPGGYMYGLLPPQVVFERRSGPATLDAMIAMQRHQREHFPADSLPRLALVLDDVLYSGTTLGNTDFKRNLKEAADFNISVIIGTANAALLPADLHTFATHVFATSTVNVHEPRQLHSKAFIMFEGLKTFQEALSLCRRHEFLVGVMRSHATAVHSFMVPSTLPVFAMAQALVDKLSFALKEPHHK